MVDQHLTFESLVRYIKGKISRGIGILYKAKKLSQASSLLTLYFLFVYSYFTYCITVWGNTYSTVLGPLMKCQKHADRVVHGAGKYDHTYPIFQSLQILNLRKLYIYSAQIFLYKYRQQTIPEVFCNFFTVTSTIHEHQTRKNSHYHSPLVRCVQRSCSLRCSWVKISNSHLDCTNYNCAYSTFKYEARTSLSSMSDADILA